MAASSVGRPRATRQDEDLVHWYHHWRDDRADRAVVEEVGILDFK